MENGRERASAIGKSVASQDVHALYCIIINVINSSGYGTSRMGMIVCVFMFVSVSS